MQFLRNTRKIRRGARLPQFLDHRRRYTWRAVIRESRKMEPQPPRHQALPLFAPAGSSQLLIQIVHFY